MAALTPSVARALLDGMYYSTSGLIPRTYDYRCTMKDGAGATIGSIDVPTMTEHLRTCGGGL